ncbi:PepSY domain-containing protein [Amaricoccus sp.]|uniref:PepSY domain-containing protein n=1 Tax=Amaricoccus sp. TaxID=1872485 RepID=UPI001B7B22ED|nr:PepSY domain-containing protein [Amaricoccus sp.]MBP7243359.1 PepSY domain-containing protein [Amaricoccus sp.]
MNAIPALMVALAATLAAPALAQEMMASPEEAEKVNAAIAQLNCGPHEEIEKETEALYELDDVVCKAAQYDIKLDGEFNVISLTYDGPNDE